jgi:hypothetical protein
MLLRDINLKKVVLVPAIMMILTNLYGFDSRIPAHSELKVTSSSPMLDKAIKKSSDYIYHNLVVGPKQRPVIEGDARIIGFRDNGYEILPSYWGSYRVREAFCSRDIVHSARGALLLSLNDENYNMLHKFAEDALKYKGIDIQSIDYTHKKVKFYEKSFWQKHWPFWSYNFYGFPYHVDAGYMELTAPFEILEIAYSMYEQSGDKRWISDLFLNYGRMLHSKFMEVYDFNGNGVADNRAKNGISSSLWEFEKSNEIPSKYVYLDKTRKPYKLVIKKKYFQEQAAQDLRLKIVFQKIDNYLTVRINNLVDSDYQEPYLNHNYIYLNSRDKFSDLEIVINSDKANRLESVFDGSQKLDLNKDYVVKNTNTVILKASYLESIKKNKSPDIKSVFIFKFSDNTEGQVIVEMSAVDSASAINKRNVTLDWNNLVDVVLEVKLDDKSGKFNLIQSNTAARAIESGDTLGVQYQSLLSMRNMLKAKAKLQPENADTLNEEALLYDSKATSLLKHFRNDWYSDEYETYARAFDGLNKPVFGWGHENSFFMATKEILEPGKRANAYLTFIHEMSEGLNKESITYLPEAFYRYGQNERAWYWLQKSLKPFTEEDEKIKNTYPELAFTNISNVVDYMMGYKADVPNNTVETFSRLPKDLDFVEASNLPVGQEPNNIIYSRKIANLVKIKHFGTHTSVFENIHRSIYSLNGKKDGKKYLVWKAKFIGYHPFIYVDNEKYTAITDIVNGVEFSYVNVKVFKGRTRVATTIKPLELSKITPKKETFSYKKSRQNRSIDGRTIKVDGISYRSGLGVHSDSAITYNLDGKYDVFTSVVGIDDEVNVRGRATFLVYLDGNVVYTYQFKGSFRSHTIVLKTTDVKTMKLVVKDGRDGKDNDHADWANAYLLIKE